MRLRNADSENVDIRPVRDENLARERGIGDRYELDARNADRVRRDHLPERRRPGDHEVGGHVGGGDRPGRARTSAGVVPAPAVDRATRSARTAPSRPRQTAMAQRFPERRLQRRFGPMPDGEGEVGARGGEMHRDRDGRNRDLPARERRLLGRVERRRRQPVEGPGEDRGDVGQRLAEDREQRKRRDRRDGRYAGGRMPATSALLTSTIARYRSSSAGTLPFMRSTRSPPRTGRNGSRHGSGNCPTSSAYPGSAFTVCGTRRSRGRSRRARIRSRSRRGHGHASASFTDHSLHPRDAGPRSSRGGSVRAGSRQTRFVATTCDHRARNGYISPGQTGAPPGIRTQNLRIKSPLLCH